MFVILIYYFFRHSAVRLPQQPPAAAANKLSSSTSTSSSFSVAGVVSTGAVVATLSLNLLFLLLVLLFCYEDCVGSGSNKNCFISFANQHKVSHPSNRSGAGIFGLLLRSISLSGNNGTVVVVHPANHTACRSWSAMAAAVPLQLQTIRSPNFSSSTPRIFFVNDEKVADYAVLHAKACRFCLNINNATAASPNVAMAAAPVTASRTVTCCNCCFCCSEACCNCCCSGNWRLLL